MSEQKLVSVFKLSHPSSNVRLSLDGKVVEAARVQYAFTPKIEDDAECVSKTNAKVTVKTWNQKNFFGVRSSLKAWTCRNYPVPSLALVDDPHGALVIPWPSNQYVVTGQAPFGYPVIGRLGVEISGVWTVDPANNEVGGYTAAVPVAEPVVKKKKNVKAEGEGPRFICWESDSFIITKDGHYMDVKELKKPEGQRFLVPKNFAEFVEFDPKYLINWVKKRLHKFTVDADVEDWASDLALHLCGLSEDSKYREMGKTDLVQTFDPYKQYGANIARFKSYINTCLANKMSTGQKRAKNEPIRRPDTVSLTSEELVDGAEYCGEVTAESVYANSEVLSVETTRVEKNHEDRFFTSQFEAFVAREEPSMSPVINALMVTRTHKEAVAQYTLETGLVITAGEFTKFRKRLQTLAACFMSGAPIPALKSKRRDVTTMVIGETMTNIEDFITLELDVFGAHVMSTPNGRSTVFAIAPFEAAKKLRFNSTCPWSNPRLGNTLEGKQSDVVKMLYDSAKNESLKFLDRNGGVVLFSDTATVSTSEGKTKIVLKFAKGKKRGLGDGGTTTQTLADLITKFPNLIGFFKLEIRCGDFTDEEVTSIAGTLNKRKAVDKHSLANHSGGFKTIRTILEAGKSERPPVPKIKYFTGDKGEMEITEVLKYLCSIMMKNPVPAYNSTNDPIEFVKSEEGSAECLRYNDLLVDILYYSEYIQEQLDVRYGERLKEYGIKFNKNPITLPMTGLKTHIKMDNALLIPMLVALKGAINQDTMTWIVKPEVIIEKAGDALLDELLQAWDEKKSWNLVGKNAAIYKNMTLRVENFILRQGR